MPRFAITFTVLLIALFSLEMLSVSQENVVVPFTEAIARVSAFVVVLFDDSVITYGKVLQLSDTGFAVSIEAGCNGVEATIVLIAAVLAYPARWAQRMAAIAIGFLAIQLLNIARIISLLYLGNWNLDIFSWVHLYLWPTLIMLDVLVVFVLYIRHLSFEESAAMQAT